MTGLLGGGHAIYFDAATRRGAQPRLLRRGAVGRRRADGVAARPVRRGARALRDRRVVVRRARAPGRARRALARARPAAVGAARRAGARGSRASGVAMPPAHASCLAMLEPVMTMREGAAIYAPGGALLGEGDLLGSRGSSRRSSSSATRAPRRSTRLDRARRCSRSSRSATGSITARRPRRVRARWSEPVEVRVRRAAGATRAGLSRRARDARALRSGRRRRRAARGARRRRAGDGHTTNLTVVDADGNACVLTTSLGLGSGDWLPGLDLHLNSMLGETDLIREPLAPGRADGEHDGAHARLRRRRARARARRAGGTRLRTALVGVLARVLHDGLDAAGGDRPAALPSRPASS